MNPYVMLKALLPDAPLLVGEVIGIDNNIATIELVDGTLITARGTAALSDHVFVRDGVIEGKAPDLPVVVIEV